MLCASCHRKVTSAQLRPLPDDPLVLALRDAMVLTRLGLFGTVTTGRGRSGARALWEPEVRSPPAAAFWSAGRAVRRPPPDRGGRQLKQLGPGVVLVVVLLAVWLRVLGRGTEARRAEGGRGGGARDVGLVDPEMDGADRGGAARGRRAGGGAGRGHRLAVGQLSRAGRAGRAGCGGVGRGHAGGSWAALTSVRPDRKPAAVHRGAATNLPGVRSEWPVGQAS